MSKLFVTRSERDPDGERKVIAPEEIMERLENTIVALKRLKDVSYEEYVSVLAPAHAFLDNGPRSVTGQPKVAEYRLVWDAETDAVFSRYTGLIEAFRVRVHFKGDVEIVIPEVKLSGEWVNIAVEYLDRLPSLGRVEQMVESAAARKGEVSMGA